MIRGRFNADLEASVTLTVQGPDGQEFAIRTVIDTGFTGFLTLPAAIISSLGLPWLGRGQATLGDGKDQLFDVYSGTVIWDERPLIIEVDSAETDPLVGMSLIYGHDLRIQAIEEGQVTIRALPSM